MLFSIVVPVYNVQDFLKECIESIIPQIIGLPEGAELILVDDGSQDQSGMICDEYHKMYPELIHVYHKKNEGLLLARRFGFEKACGKYILNCDSDDICEKTFIADLKKIIGITQADVVLYNLYVLDKDGKVHIFFENIFTDKEMVSIDKKDVLLEFMSSYKIISMCCKTFKKDCLNLDYDYSSYKNLSQGEDTMQSVEVYTAAQTFAYYNKPLYYYRMGSGMTEEYQESFYSQYKDVFEYIQKYIHKWEINGIDRLMALKLFSSVGRAVIQSRLKTSMTYQKRKEYLKKIREDSLVLKYEWHYPKIKGKLKNNHKIMCSLLLSKHYFLIDIILRIKNIIE